MKKQSKIQLRVKSGDLVRVMTGKDKGKEGKIVQAFPAKNLVVVEGLNQRVKHIKKRGAQAGQRVTYSAPMNASNVQLLKDGKVVRVEKRSK